MTDRKRRDYESLFASNVVLSRRPENERPDAGRVRRTAAPARSDPASPSIDDIADAVVRATTLTAGLTVTRPAQFPPQPPAPLPPSSHFSQRRTAHHDLRPRSAPQGRCIACSKARSSTPC